MDDLTPEIRRLITGPQDDLLAELIQRQQDEVRALIRTALGPGTAELIAAGASARATGPSTTPKSYEQVEQECVDYFVGVLVSLTDEGRARLLLRLQRLFLDSIHPDQPAAPEPTEN